MWLLSDFTNTICFSMSIAFGLIFFLLSRAFPRRLCKHILSLMIFTIPVAAFQMTLSQLEHCTKNISWLLCDVEHFSSPPIAADEPTMCYIWELIAIITTGSSDDQLGAAKSLGSLAQEDDYRKLIIEEGGVHALFNLLERGTMEGQEYAAKAIVLLGKDPDSFKELATDAFTIFTKLLIKGPSNIQAIVAWAASELAANDSPCYTYFSSQHFIQLLIRNILRNRNHNTDTIVTNHANSSGNIGTSQKEDTDIYMKTMTARALWKLAIDNSRVCEIISNTFALGLFAVFLEQSSEELRYHSAMTLMEISAVAEKDSDLRRSTFRRRSPVCQAIIKQSFRLIEMADPELLVPCVRIVGNLARIFRATDAGMISPLVKLLDDKDQQAGVYKEACVALAKFACYDNYLSMEYSNAIIGAGGVSSLVRLVYFEEKTVQLSALELLCYVVVHVQTGAKVLQDARMLLKWVSEHLMDAVSEHLEYALRRLEIHLRLYT